MFETGMANKIGGVVTHFAKTERQLIIAIMVIVGLMSGVLSNTGTAAVLIPVVIGIAAKSGYSRSRLLMPLVFAAAMGGNLSLIGAPGNLIAQSAMGEIGLSFGFFEYAKVGLPILIAGILYFAFIGYKFLPEKQGSTESSYDEQKDFSNVPKWKQMMSLIILILTLLGMIFEDKIGIKLCVIGCVGALALIITGVISEKNALKSIDLKTIFLFGGTLSLAAALQETGAGEEIATAVIGILGKNPSPYVLTFVVFMLCWYLRTLCQIPPPQHFWFQSAYQLPQRLELTRVQYLWHVLSVVHVHTPHLSVCLPTQWSLQPEDTPSRIMQRPVFRL